MTRRPSHLTPTNAATWQHPDAVAAYVHRAPYPGASFERLALEDGRVVQQVVVTVYFGTPRRAGGAMG